EAARAAGKTVELEVSGEAVEMDNTIVEQIADPLLHLIQNAITHGIEPEDERLAAGKPAAGTMKVRAYQRSGAVYVEVADDGRGIDADHLRDAAVERVMRVRRCDVRMIGGVETVRVEDQVADFIRLSEALGLPGGPGASALPVLALRAGRKVLAVAVDEFLGKEEIVVKSPGSFLEGMGPYSGATISGEGRVILVLDGVRLAERGGVADGPAESIIAPERPGFDGRCVLLVDDSISIRKFVGQMLERGGFSVVTAN